MKYTDGGSLRDYLEKNFNGLTWSQQLQLALQISYIIARLHDEGIIHCDLVIQLFSFINQWL